MIYGCLARVRVCVCLFMPEKKRKKWEKSARETTKEGATHFSMFPRLALVHSLTHSLTLSLSYFSFTSSTTHNLHARASSVVLNFAYFTFFRCQRVVLRLPSLFLVRSSMQTEQQQKQKQHVYKYKCVLFLLRLSLRFVVVVVTVSAGVDVVRLEV